MQFSIASPLVLHVCRLFIIINRQLKLHECGAAGGRISSLRWCLANIVILRNPVNGLITWKCRYEVRVCCSFVFSSSSCMRNPIAKLNWKTNCIANRNMCAAQAVPYSQHEPVHVGEGLIVFGFNEGSSQQFRKSELRQWMPKTRSHWMLCLGAMFRVVTVIVEDAKLHRHRSCGLNSVGRIINHMNFRYNVDVAYVRRIKYDCPCPNDVVRRAHVS